MAPERTQRKSNPKICNFCLDLSPDYVLQFDHPKSMAATVTATVRIRNPLSTKRHVAFKLRTNRRDGYLTKPSLGVLPPGCQETVTVTLLEKARHVLLASSQLKDKFSVGSISPDKILIETQFVSDTFASLFSKNSETCLIRNEDERTKVLRAVWDALSHESAPNQQKVLRIFHNFQHINESTTSEIPLDILCLRDAGDIISIVNERAEVPNTFLCANELIFKELSDAGRPGTTSHSEPKARFKLGFKNLFYKNTVSKDEGHPALELCRSSDSEDASHYEAQYDSKKTVKNRGREFINAGHAIKAKKRSKSYDSICNVLETRQDWARADSPAKSNAKSRRSKSKDAVDLLRRKKKDGCSTRFEEQESDDISNKDAHDQQHRGRRDNYSVNIPTKTRRSKSIEPSHLLESPCESERGRRRVKPNRVIAFEGSRRQPPVNHFQHEVAGEMRYEEGDFKARRRSDSVGAQNNFFLRSNRDYYDAPKKGKRSKSKDSYDLS